MTWTAQGTVVAQNSDKTGGSTSIVSGTNGTNGGYTPVVGDVVIVSLALDNQATVDGDTTLVTSVTDSKSNTYVRLREYTNARGAALGGTTVSAWACLKVTAGWDTSTTVTANHSSTTARVIRASAFTPSGGQGAVKDATTAFNIGTAADPASFSLTPTHGNRAYLWLYFLGTEGPVGDTDTVDSTNGWTRDSFNGTTGGQAATNQSVVFGYKISTASSLTANWTHTADDYAQLIIALVEVPTQAIAVSETTTVSITKNIPKTVASTTTNTVAVAKSIPKTIAAVATIAMALVKNKIWGQAIAVTETTTVALKRNTGKLISALSTLTAALTRYRSSTVLIDQHLIDGGATGINGASGSNEAAGQSFTLTPGEYDVTKVALFLDVLGSPTDNITLELVAGNVAGGSGAVLSTSTPIAANTLDPSGQWVEFDIISHNLLGGQYFLRLTRDGSRDVSNRVQWRRTTSNPLASDDRWTLDSGAWTNTTTTDQSFMVYGTALPTAYAQDVITQDTNTGDHTVTITPGGKNRLLVAFVFQSGDTYPPVVTDSKNGTWAGPIKTNTRGGDASALWFYVRNQLTTGGASIDVTAHGDGTDSGGGINVIELQGVARTGAAAVRQSAGQNNHSGGTPTDTFGVAALTGNIILVAAANASNPASITKPTNYTEIEDVGYSTPASGYESSYRNSGETGTVIAMTGPTTSTASMAIEIDTSTPGTKTAVIQVNPSMSFAMTKRIPKAIAAATTLAVSLVRNTAKFIAITITDAINLVAQFTGGGHNTPQAINVTATSTVTINKNTTKFIGISETTVVALAKNITKLVAVAETSTVSLVRSTGKLIAVAGSSTVALSRNTGKLVSLSVVSVISLARRTSKTVAVTVTDTVTLAAAKIKAQAINVTETTTVAISRNVGKLVSVTESSAVALSRNVGKLVAVAESSVVALSRKVGKTIAVTVTDTIALTASKTKAQLIAITETTTVAISRGVGKLVSVAETTSVSVAKNTSKAIAASTTAVVSLSRNVGKLIAVAVTNTVALATTKTKSVAIAVTETTTVAISRNVGKLVSITESTAVSLTKNVGQPIAAVTTILVTLTRNVGKKIAITITDTVSLTAQKTVSKAITVTTTLAVSLVRNVGKPVAVSVTDTVALVANTIRAKTIAVTESTTVVLSRNVGKPIATATTAAVALSRRVAKTIAVTVTDTVVLLTAKTKQQAVNVTTTVTLALSRNVGKLVTVLESTAVSVARTTAKTIATTSTAAVSITKNTAKRVAITITDTVVLVAQKSFQRAVAVTMTATVAMSRVVGKPVAVATTLAVSISRTTKKFIAATTTVVATVNRGMYRVIAATSTATITLKRNVGKLIGITPTITANVTPTVTHVFVASASFDAAVNISSSQTRDLLRSGSINTVIDLESSFIRDLLRSASLNGLIVIDSDGHIETEKTRSVSVDTVVSILASGVISKPLERWHRTDPLEVWDHETEDGGPEEQWHRTKTLDQYYNDG